MEGCAFVSFSFDRTVVLRRSLVCERSEVEFWAGKPSRLHDRVRYLREVDLTEAAPWKIERLAP